MELNTYLNGYLKDTSINFLGMDNIFADLSQEEKKIVMEAESDIIKSR